MIKHLLKYEMIQNLVSNVITFLNEASYFLAKVSGKVVAPKYPMLDEKELRALSSMSGASSYFLEYGSGGSTGYLAERNLGLTTVESDKHFLNAVITCNEDKRNVHYIYANIGPTKSFGQPLLWLKLLFKSRWGSYANSPWDSGHFNNMYGGIFIDGRFRVSCFLVTLLRNEMSEYKILIDDYFKRDEYRVVEEVAGTPERHGNAALFHISRKKLDIDLIEKLRISFQEVIN